MRAVETFTCFAVFISVYAAAIATIPITTSVVVVVIAIFIFFPLWRTTTFFHRADTFVTLDHKCAVLALAT